MAEQTSNEERAAEKSFDESPKSIKKATLIMAIGGIVLVIIATFIIMSFFQNDTNKGTSNVSTYSNQSGQ